MSGDLRGDEPDRWIGIGLAKQFLAFEAVGGRHPVVEAAVKKAGEPYTPNDCRLDAVNDRVVRVTGMKWRPQSYTIKLEGVRRVGYSAFAIAATRDPGLIGQIDSFLEFVRSSTATKVQALGIAAADYNLVLRVYGRDGVMGGWEPEKNAQPVELSIIAEVVAQTQEVANAALSLARVTLLHSDFPGRMCREGNMAFPFSPSDVERGAIYEFMLQHVVETDDPLGMFPIEYEQVGVAA